jgi:acetyl-CoA carboxylase biotin carboxyl carrier protein
MAGLPARNASCNGNPADMAKEQNEPSPQVFDVERIRQLIKLMDEHQLNEIDLRQMDRRIRLRRGPAEGPAMMGYPAMPYPAPAASAASSPAPAKAQPAESPGVFIKSPMVGTFYSRPKPTAPPFVKVGDMVQPETVVCVVEAMKTFNELPAGVSGKIVEILVKDEQPVDVNKPLFRVAP